MSYKEPEFYDVIRRGSFYIDVKPCEKLEDLSDSFITREDLEMINPNNHYWNHNNRIYLSAEIRAACEEWANLIPDNAMGTIRTTPHIATMIQELCPGQIRNHIQNGFTIRGDRIINIALRNTRREEQYRKEAIAANERQAEREAAPYQRQNEIIRSDMSKIKSAFEYLLMQKYQVSYNYRYRSTISIFVFMKRLCNWEDIAKQHRKHAKKKEYLQDLIFMKQLWNDPTLEP